MSIATVKLAHQLAPARPAPHRAAGAPQRVAPDLAGNQAALRRGQAKRQIGAVNDPQERAADQMADRVMRMTGPAPAAVRGQCTDCGGGDRLNRKAVAGPAGGEAPASVQQTLGEAGQPLSNAARAFFEPRFGRPLDHVRMHEGGRAAESAQAIGAVAYASGRHVVLGHAAPSSESTAGRRLLAHELSHVLQQEPGAPVRRACGPQAIGTPVGCEAGDKSFVSGTVVHFVVNCDDPTAAGAKELTAFARALPPAGTIQIDGYASVDGPEAFNFNLAAARALNAKRQLLAAGVPAARIGRLVDHGATPGPADERRSVVLSVGESATAPAPKADETPQPPPKTVDRPPGKPDAKPDTKPDVKQDAKPDAKPDVPSGVPKVEGKPKDDTPSVLEFQLPISETVQVPVGKPGGVGVTPPPGQQNQALNQVNQPNVAAGVNYTPAPVSFPRLSFGLFGQLGLNFPIGLKNYPLPQTRNNNPAYFTGINTQIYLQPAFVLFKAGPVTVSGVVQPGVGWTFKSPVPGEDGVTYTVQGGLQASGDITKKWQFVGSILAGGALAKPYEPQAGQTPAWQPFVGAQLSFQFHTPIIE